MWGARRVVHWIAGLALVLGLAAGCASGSAEPEREVLVAPRCTQPTPPDLPDGATASHEDMATARQQVTAFLANAESYLDCLKALEGLEAEGDEERRNRMVDDHNRMVDTMEDVAERFNVELREFRLRESGQTPTP